MTDEQQASHDSLQALLDQTNASYDSAQTDEQRATLEKIADATSVSLTQLNQQDMHSRTGDINAAEDPLKASIDKLNTLKDELNSISAGFAKAAAIVNGIDQAVGDLSSFIAV